MRELTLLILACLHIPQVGHKTVLKILKSQNDPRFMVDNLLIRKNISVSEWKNYLKLAESELNKAEELGIRIINYREKGYPQSLLKLKSFPVVIYAQGNLKLLNQSKIAVIGTRKPSKDGLIEGKKIVKSLVQSGFVIVSGLARGCDTCAHQTCLKSKGQTIAVLAGGLDQPVYPKENQTLAEEILESGGLLFSTYALGTKVRPQYLAARDEWQSGLSLGVIVIETGTIGGTKLTMNYCLKQLKPLAMLKDNNFPSTRNIFKIASINDLKIFMNSF